MNFEEYTSVKDEMDKNPTLCNLFKLLATETWKRMEFAYTQMNGDIHETTITQNLLFVINVYKKKYDFDIEFESSTNERTNGHDLELVLGHEGSDSIFYAPIQAKRLYPSERYDAFPHGNQIIKLIEYAEDPSKGSYPNGFPLYLFYNYLELTARQKRNLTRHKVCENSIDESQFGCSVISAYYVRDNHFSSTKDAKGKISYDGDLTFWNIHPDFASPWLALVCCDSEDFEKLSTKLMQNGISPETRKVIINKITGKNKQLLGLNKKEQIASMGWKKISFIANRPETEKNKPKIREHDSWEGKPGSFAPRFRISITIPSYTVDTVLVHAKPSSYNELLKSPTKWSEISIAKGRLNKIKNIAFYVSRPEMQILSIATIEKFVEDKQSGKYIIYFKDLTVLKNPIKYDGSRVKSVGRVYISKNKLLKAKTWNQVFDFKRKK